MHSGHCTVLEKTETVDYKEYCNKVINRPGTFVFVEVNEMIPWRHTYAEYERTAQPGQQNDDVM